VSTRQMTRRITCSILGATLAVSACSPRSAADQQDAEAKAEQLVDSLQGAGLAPRLTTDVAVSLYGTDAAAICGVFESGLNSNEYLLLLGNPSNRRPKTVTAHSVAYTRHVIRTYCPNEQAAFDEVVGPISAIGSGR